MMYKAKAKTRNPSEFVELSNRKELLRLGDSLVECSKSKTLQAREPYPP